LDLGDEDAAGEEFEYGDLVGEGEPLVFHYSAHLLEFLAGEGAAVEAVFESVTVAFGSAAGGPQFRDAMGAAKRMAAHGPGFTTRVLTATVGRRWFVHRASYSFGVLGTPQDANAGTTEREPRAPFLGSPRGIHSGEDLIEQTCYNYTRSGGVCQGVGEVAENRE